MTKEDCVLCRGSGWTNPYPYRRKKKCDHRWSRGSFMERYNTTHDAIQYAEEEHAKWARALESEVKSEGN